MTAESVSEMTPTAKRALRFAVIGAGMSGILTAIKLRQLANAEFTVYEKADRLGGTWRDNSYPGLSCDVPSHLYSYSFELNPEWSQRFSPGAEIWDYLERVADKYGVTPYIRCNTEIAKCDYREGKWHLETMDGDGDVVDVVIAATGVLHKPVYPKIDGLDSFQGACFHSARWDHSLPLDGKRVGIVGTGSTAIQILPAIVDRVAKVSLFQRTAQWILPIANPHYSEQEKAQFRSHPAQMQTIYDDWLGRFNHTFARAVVGDKRQMGRLEDLCNSNLDENVLEPELKARLTPDYQVACKRLVMSDAFYPAIQRDNAALVTAGIERIEAAGVRTTDGVLHELDLLVLATGFDGHNFMRPMQVVGRSGLDLEQTWAGGNEAYRSVAIPDFPNFFMLVGPNSPIGNFSLILISEMQLNYVLQLVDLLLDGRAREIAPSRAATRHFNDAIQSAMNDTVWVSGCQSWYLDKNGNPAMWPYSFERFAEEMKHPDLDEFELVA